MVRKERGITLIALVITIVVLLILAGITIGAITGDNGIINKALDAKEKAEIANEKEIVDLALSLEIIVAINSSSSSTLFARVPIISSAS